MDLPAIFFETFENTLPESILLKMISGTVVTVSVYVVKNVVLKEFIAFLEQNGFGDIKVVSREGEDNSTITTTLLGFTSNFQKNLLPNKDIVKEIILNPNNLNNIFFQVLFSQLPTNIYNNIDFNIVEIVIVFTINNSILEDIISFLDIHGYKNILVNNGNTNNTPNKDNLLKLYNSTDNNNSTVTSNSTVTPKYRNPFNLSGIRNNTTKNSRYGEAKEPDLSQYKADKALSLPPLYYPGTDTVNQENAKLRKEATANIDKIVDAIERYAEGLIYCDYEFVSSYKSAIKTLLRFLVNNNAYTETGKDEDEALMYLNFSFISKFCQSYLLVKDIFTDKEEVNCNKYLREIYVLIRPVMLSKVNNWRFGLGRASYLLSAILQDDNMFEDGKNILKFALQNINDNGTIKSEMDRKQRSYVYNVKAANFIFDMLSIRNKIMDSNNSSDETTSIEDVVNLIFSVYNVNEKLTGEDNLYAKITKLDQEMPDNKGNFNFTNYNFVQNELSEKNTKKLNEMKPTMVKNGIIDESPLAMGP
jgi:hypothetical protein